MEMSQPQENLYYGPPEHLQFCQQLDQVVGSVPGVTSVSAMAHLPIGGGSAGRGIAIEGRPDPDPENRPGAGYTVACPNVLRTLGIPLRGGRDFTGKDATGTPSVALINESMAKAYWPGEDAVGKRFQIGSRVDGHGDWLTIVGVFADVRHRLDRPMEPLFIRPFNQAGWPFLAILVKDGLGAVGFVAPVKHALRVIEPNQPVSDRTMDNIIGESVVVAPLPDAVAERLRARWRWGCPPSA